MSSTISTVKAPSAIGPYSQGVKCAGLIFVSGQIPVDPATGEFAEGGAGELAAQSLKNIKSILEAAGSSMDRVVKTVIFLTDMSDFAEVNAAYAGFFTEGHYPARSCVEVSKLPKGARLEIEAIAEE